MHVCMCNYAYALHTPHRSRWRSHSSSDEAGDASYAYVRGICVCTCVHVCICTAQVPLEVAFESQMRREMGDGWVFWMAWNLVVDFTFIADIVVSFRTGKYVRVST